jgi:hypothetical protein
LHLRAALNGFLWTTVRNTKRPKSVAGTAESANPKGGKWQIARQEHQLRRWFGTRQLDFLIDVLN